jgi:Ca-activated chloride channel family protein
LLDEENPIENASDNLRFASAVAGFGLVLRDSRYKGNATYGNIARLAQNSLGSDLKNYRSDFLNLVRKATVIRN